MIADLVFIITLLAFVASLAYIITALVALVVGAITTRKEARRGH